MRKESIIRIALCVAAVSASLSNSILRALLFVKQPCLLPILRPIFQSLDFANQVCCSRRTILKGTGGP